KTTYANYHPGERATIHLQHQALAQSEENWSLKLTVEKNEQEVFTLEDNLKVIDLMQTKSIIIPEDVTPAFYNITCELNSEDGETRQLHQAHWRMDTTLLREVHPLTVGRDPLEHDGRP